MRVARMADRSTGDIRVTYEIEGERPMKRRSKLHEMVENTPPEVYFDLAGTISSK